MLFRSNFHAVSTKLCSECATQDPIRKFWTHTEKDFVKYALKGMTANVIVGRLLKVGCSSVYLSATQIKKIGGCVFL